MSGHRDRLQTTRERRVAGRPRCPADLAVSRAASHIGPACLPCLAAVITGSPPRFLDSCTPPAEATVVCAVSPPKKPGRHPRPPPSDSQMWATSVD